MLGQPVSLLIPQVVGFRLTGRLPEGATASDLVLTVTEMLRKKGVVGKFVEFYGPGVASLPLADRATIGNMAPEYGATVGIFPVDQETLRYLAFTGRPKELVALVEAYMKEQGLFQTPGAPEPEFSDTLAFDLATVEPSLAGPRRPQDRVPLREVKKNFLDALPTLMKPTSPVAPPATPNARRWEEEGGNVAVATEAPPARQGHVNLRLDGAEHKLRHGSVVIAAITSCTNTSNPSVMVAAALAAKKAVERGLRSQPWVKTSLAPGSKVVTDYLREAGLMTYLEQLRFHLVGYGCTTCIGNSGPLPEAVSAAVAEGELVVCAVLSGNRNFEGRIQSEVRANYLASPPLVVAYALAGRVDIDIQKDPIGTGKDGKPVYLRDIWPTAQEVDRVVRSAIKSAMFHKQYGEVFEGDERWKSLPVPAGERFAWEPDSTYVRRPPYFEGMPETPPPVADIRGARVLCLLGDSITTDHISPAGSIRKTHPAGPRLLGVRVVIAESYERIHRSNLVGMGILPLQFQPDQGVQALGLTGRESFDITGVAAVLAEGFPHGKELGVKATRPDGTAFQFRTIVRIDTPQELQYYRHGGILEYVLRQLAGKGNGVPTS